MKFSFLNKQYLGLPLIIIFITLAGGFLRLYNLSGTLQFLGDQGRDALILHRLLIEKDPVFIGPVTSVGNMYLGPAYYYMVLPFYALTYPSPMGPVYAIALLGTLTIPVLYLIAKEMTGQKSALLATIIFAFSWTFIYNTRFSWNPNPAPIVSLIMIWATYRAIKIDVRYWILVSLSFALLIQFHYLTLLALPAAGLIYLADAINYWRHHNQLKPNLLKATVISLGLFLLSLSPLALFDLKHDWLNARAFYNILFGKEEQLRSVEESGRTLQEFLGRSLHIIFETTLDQTRIVNTALVVGVVIMAVVLWRLKDKLTVGRRVVLTWLLVGIVGTALYRSSVFDHYVAYLFPVTAMVLGMIGAELWRRAWIGEVLVVAFLGWFFWVNIPKYQLADVGWTIQDMEKYTYNLIPIIASNQPYSLVSVNHYLDLYAMNYRYYLTVFGMPPLETEEIDRAESLIILNETENTPQQIIDLPVYEIVKFPEKGNYELIKFNAGPEVILLKK